MSFERQRRIAGLWNWLPAFRAAAEFESIQRAALALRVSPSAISRAVKQLEEAVGFDVFERRTTGVRLTPRGVRLLEAVRQGMRGVDDALEPLSDDPVRVGVVAPFCGPLVARALPATGWATLVTVPGDAAAALLNRGEVDVVFTHLEAAGSRLSCREVVAVALCTAHHAQHPGAAPWDLLEPSCPVRELAAALELARRGQGAVTVPVALAPPDLAHSPSGRRLKVYAVTRSAAASANHERVIREACERLAALR